MTVSYSLPRAEEKLLVLFTPNPHLLDETASEASDSDLEADIIEHWQKKGRLKLSQRQYFEAASYLEKALERARAKHGRDINFEGRDGTLELLATAYCHQGKLNEVEEILSKYSEQYEGKLKILDMLVSAHCKRNQWEQAEKLVLKHTDAQMRDQRLGALAVRCSRASQWTVAKNILLKQTSFEGRDKILKLSSVCML